MFNWPCGPRLPGFPPPPRGAIPLPLQSMVGKAPNSALVTPVFMPYPLGGTPAHGLEGKAFTSPGIWLPRAPAQPAVRSFTQVDLGVHVQRPVYSVVLLTPKVPQYGCTAPGIL